MLWLRRGSWTGRDGIDVSSQPSHSRRRPSHDQERAEAQMTDNTSLHMDAMSQGLRNTDHRPCGRYAIFGAHCALTRSDLVGIGTDPML